MTFLGMIIGWTMVWILLRVIQYKYNRKLYDSITHQQSAVGFMKSMVLILIILSLLNLAGC